MLLSTSLTAKTIVLTLNNSHTIRTEVNSDSVDSAIRRLNYLDLKLKKGKIIYLVLDTPGGSVFAGNRLITFAKSLGREVKTISIFSASMGFQIVQALGERLAVQDAILMAHPGATQCSGNIYEILPCVYRLKKFDDLMTKRAAKRLKMDVKKYREMIRYEKWWMDVDLVKEGVIDRIVGIKCSKKLRMSSYVIKSSNIFTPDQKVSACPLM